MDQRPGALVLFNFVDFDEGIHKDPGAKKYPPRTSSCYDVQNIIQTFFIMNLNIFQVFNASLSEVKKNIKKLSEYDFSNYASLNLIYMSHGDEKNILYCRDGKFDVIEESKKVFRNRTLEGKPRYLIIEACKGSYDTDLCYDNEQSGGADKEPVITWSLTSSFEGFISKIGNKGSTFIQYFCKELQANWREKPYDDIVKQFIDNFPNIDQSPVLTSVSRQFKDFRYGAFDKQHEIPRSLE